MSTLFALPSEVRVAIYRYHFSGVRVTYKHRTTAQSTWSDDSCVRIFIICRQILGESRPIFFEEARINLETLINIFYGSYCCPVTDPGLIQHAYVDLQLLSSDGSAFRCGDLRKVIAVMPNMRSLIFRTWEATYGFEGSEFEEGLPSEDHKAFMINCPGRLIGQDEESGDERDSSSKAIQSIISAWKQRQKSFQLLSEVNVLGCWDYEGDREALKGYFDLDTAVLRLNMTDAPNQTLEITTTTLAT